MKSVNPYINFDGNCEEAFEFYQSVFGGEPEITRFRDMTGMPGIEEMSEESLKKIANMQLAIGGGTSLMGDDGAGVFGAGVKVGDNVGIEIEPESAEEADKLFKGLSEGGEVKMELQETEWAEKFGQCTDKYGVRWMFSYGGEKTM